MIEKFLSTPIPEGIIWGALLLSLLLLCTLVLLIHLQNRLAETSTGSADPQEEDDQEWPVIEKYGLCGGLIHITVIWTTEGQEEIELENTFGKTIEVHFEEQDSSENSYLPDEIHLDPGHKVKIKMDPLPDSFSLYYLVDGNDNDEGLELCRP